MPVEWTVEPLSAAHDRTAFECGEPALDEYLRRYARQNQDSGVARTFVATAPSTPSQVLGYYALTVGAIDKANLPEAAARRFPRFPLPIARIGRLAVDRTHQGRGLGEFLLMDALHRCVTIAEHVGLVAVLIDAKHERAKRFYLRYEFDALPSQPLILWLPMGAVNGLFRGR